MSNTRRPARTGSCETVSRCWGVTVVAWMAATGVGKIASGAVVPTASSDSAYVSAGASYAGLILSLQATTPTGIEHVSAFELDPWDVGTAAHNLVGVTASADASTILIGTSPNFNQPGNGVVVHANSYVINPGYVAGSSAATTPDFAIIHLSFPLPSLSESINLTSPAELDVLKYGGYGFSAAVNGNPIQDGNSRSWNMPAFNGTVSGVSPLYISGKFSSAYYSNLNANALSGDSGGPVFTFTPSGFQIYGDIVAQDGGLSDTGDTYALNLTTPTERAFIASNTSGVPEPTSLALVAAASVGLIARRRVPSRILPPPTS